jgi:hypothetical protein
MSGPLAELEDIAEVFAEAGYSCQLRSFGRFPRVILAENPYSIVACAESEGWEDLESLVSDLQAELTQLSLAENPDMRWDLYLLIHVRVDPFGVIDVGAIDRIESDTKYSRKLVRLNVARERMIMERELRPFLPLRSGPALVRSDPILLMETELINAV